MCGIAGGFHHSLSPEGEQKILQSLAHRGPDSQGLWRRPGLWLANTRLAIQDLSEAGRQPMLSPDGRCCLVYNGELYQAATLRNELIRKGHTFQSDCDTEVLLHAYLAWGEDCLHHLNGDFAFALWDEAAQRLFLARDPLGVKPLYFYQKEGILLFASTLPALRSISELDFSLRPEVFATYLSYLYCPSEATPFRYVRKLLPGHSLSLPFNGPIPDARRYYRIPMPAADERLRPTALQELNHTLQEVVSSQLHADVPVGIMLSGGLDSSLIAAWAKASGHAEKIQAFCINTGDGLSAEGFDDDLPYARKAAQHLDLPLQEIPGVIEPSGSWIDSMTHSLGEPQADPAAWYVGQIASAAKNKGVHVLLSGAGGDDVFSGYRRHLAIPAYKMLRFLPKSSARWPHCLPVNLVLQRRLEKLFSAAGMQALHAAVHSHLWTKPAEVHSLFQNDISIGSQEELLLLLLEEIPDEKQLLQQMLFLEQRSFLPHHNLAYTDQMCMAHSIEARVPFADAHIVNCAAALPPVFKLRGRTTKWILRELAAPLLPREIIERRKTGFGAPLRAWMSGPMQAILHERLLDKTFLNYGFFRPEAIEKLIVQQATEQHDAAYTLFSLLCIESWLRQFAATA
ncbi:MAG: asparagine synthase (glutamine-hydrolyzing) [Bacteroidetes bacterium]|nr:asparagine synthase (glutamine-hydrolyzing) [Bacteroidota bacterium]